jgi:RimJ/RimL family protein N-acetyltransferase
MSSYKALNKNEFHLKEYSIVPIREIDKFVIMKWRNEQIYHLRQSEKLNEKIQTKYFNDVILPLFSIEFPPQILFSFMKKNKIIGYGGLVHINWFDKNAEISFIMDTKLEKVQFKEYWTIFLKLIEMVSFDELKMHKINTYAFDLRPKLYEVLESMDYYREATLKEHCFFNGIYKDVVIHSKLNPHDK